VVLQAKLHAFNQTRSSSICWLLGKLFNAPADNEFCALSSIITPKITETQCGEVLEWNPRRILRRLS